MGRNILALMGCMLIAESAAAASRGLGEGAPAVAEQRYQIGVQLYRQGKYANAAREFRVAQTLMPKSAKLAYNIARSLERAGEIDAAVKAYDEYLRLAPHAADRPAVKQVRAALVAELKKQQARLVITSHPDGADIFLDGALAKPVGRTPLTVEVMSGDHAVRLVKAGFRPEDRTVPATAKQSISVAFDLRPEAKAAPVPVPAQAQAETPATAWRPIAGWALVAAGAGALVLGVVSHVRATDTADQGDKLGPGQPLRAKDLQDELDSRTTLMWAGYGAGAALVGAGAVLLLWPEGSGPSATVTDHGGVVWGWSGTW